MIKPRSHLFVLTEYSVAELHPLLFLAIYEWMDVVALAVIEGLKIQPPPYAKSMSFMGLKWMGSGAGAGPGDSVFSGNVSVASCKFHHLISEEPRW